MLSLLASSILTLAAIALAIGVWRQQLAGNQARRELDREREELESLIAGAPQESQRLDAAIAKARGLGLGIAGTAGLASSGTRGLAAGRDKIGRASCRERV